MEAIRLLEVALQQSATDHSTGIPLGFDNPSTVTIVFLSSNMRDIPNHHSN